MMWKRKSDRLPLAHPQLGELAHNPVMCPDWESNQQPFSPHVSAQSTEPHKPKQQGLFVWFFKLWSSPQMYPMAARFLTNTAFTPISQMCLVGLVQAGSRLGAGQTAGKLFAYTQHQQS